MRLGDNNPFVKPVAVGLRTGTPQPLPVFDGAPAPRAVNPCHQRAYVDSLQQIPCQKKSKKSLNSVLSKVAKNVVIKQVKSKPSERIVKDIKPKPAPITKQATRKERTIKKGGSY